MKTLQEVGNWTIARNDEEVKEWQRGHSYNSPFDVLSHRKTSLNYPVLLSAEYDADDGCSYYRMLEANDVIDIYNKMFVDI